MPQLVKGGKHVFAWSRILGTFLNAHPELEVFEPL